MEQEATELTIGSENTQKPTQLLRNLCLRNTSFSVIYNILVEQWTSWEQVWTICEHTVCTRGAHKIQEPVSHWLETGVGKRTNTASLLRVTSGQKYIQDYTYW